MMFTVIRTLHFRATHHLPQLAPSHPCRQPHGHDYTVRVALSARDIDADGFVRDDCSMIDAAVGVLDGANLAEHVAPEYTTPECLSAILYAIFRKHYPEVQRVTVSDAPNREYAYEGTMPPHWAREQATALLTAIADRHRATPRSEVAYPPGHGRGAARPEREAERPIVRE